MFEQDLSLFIRLQFSGFTAESTEKKRGQVGKFSEILIILQPIFVHEFAIHIAESERDRIRQWLNVLA